MARRRSRGGVLMALTLATATLGSGVYAWCRQNVTVSDPDGTRQVCDWYCVVYPSGVITSGCE